MYQQNSLFRRLLRSCALVLSVIFAFTSVVQADTAAAIGQRSLPVTAAPSVAPSALDLLADFPAEYGTLKTKYQGKSGRYVIHVQDAHINEDAQKNIARLLTYFAEKHSLDLVNIEGAEGELATEYFKFVSSKEARKSVADYFLRQGRLTGTEYSVIVDQPDFVVNGVEDKALYDLNKQAYLDALSFKAKDEELLAQIHKTLNDVSRFVFSSEIRDLNSKRLVFQQSGHDLVAYVRALQTFAAKNQINLTQYPGMQALVELTELETKIDFAQAEKEVDVLMRDIKKALPSEMLSEYLTKTVHYRMKKLPRGQFYGYLSGVARQALGQDARAPYQNALDYLRYIQSYENIDAGLFDEIANLDQAVRFAELTSDDQKGLDHLWRIYDVISKLFDFTLTKDDAEFFFANRAEFSGRTFTNYLEPKLKQYHFSYGLPSLESLDLDLARLEKFYDFAIQRDSVLIENALAKADEGDHRVSAIVTGGFHTPGIERALREQGISYLVVTPKITKAIDQVKDAKLYEDAMKGVPLKIEKQIDQAMAAHKKAALNDPRFQLSAWTNFVKTGEALQLDSLAGVMVALLGSAAAATEVLSKQPAVSVLPEGLRLQHALVDGQPYVRIMVGSDVLAVKVSPVLNVEGKRLSSNPVITVKEHAFELIQTNAPSDAQWVDARSEVRDAGLVAVGDAYQNVVIAKNKKLLEDNGYVIPASKAASTVALVERILRRENLGEILSYLKGSDFDGDFRVLRFGFENGTMPTLVARINAWNAAVASDLKALDVAETPEIHLTAAKSIILGFSEERIKNQVAMLVENGLPVTTATMKYSSEKIAAEVQKRQPVVQQEMVVEPALQPVQQDPVYLANLSMLEKLLPDYGKEEGFTAADFESAGLGNLLKTVEAGELEQRIHYVIKLLKGRDLFKGTDKNSRIALLQFARTELEDTVAFLDTAEGDLKMDFTIANLIKASQKDESGERIVLKEWADQNIVIGETATQAVVAESPEVKMLLAQRRQAASKLEAALKLAEKVGNAKAVQNIQTALAALNSSTSIQSPVAEDNQRDVELEANKFHRFYQARIDSLKDLMRRAREAGNEALAAKYDERWQAIRGFAVSPLGRFVSYAFFFLLMSPYAFGGLASTVSGVVQDQASAPQFAGQDQDVPAGLAPQALMDAELNDLAAVEDLFSDPKQMEALGVPQEVVESGLDAVKDVAAALQEQPDQKAAALDVAAEFTRFANQLLIDNYGEEYRDRLEGIANELVPTVTDATSFEAAKNQLAERMDATFPVAEEPSSEPVAEEGNEELAAAIESLKSHAAEQKLLDSKMQSRLDEHVALLATKINNDADLNAAKASIDDKVEALNQEYADQPVMRSTPEAAEAVVESEQTPEQSLDARLAEVFPGFKKMLADTSADPADVDEYRNVILRAVFEGRDTKFPDKHKTVLVEWNLNPFRGAMQSADRLLEKIEAGHIVVNPDFRAEIAEMVDAAGFVKVSTPEVSVPAASLPAQVAAEASETAVLGGLPAAIADVGAEAVRDIAVSAPVLEVAPAVIPQGLAQVDVSDALVNSEREQAAASVDAGFRAGVIGMSADAVGEKLTAALKLSAAQQAEQVAFERAREINFYSDRMEAYLVNEARARTHYLRDSGAVSDEVVERLDARMGLMEVIANELLKQLREKAPEGDLSKLSAADYQAQLAVVLESAEVVRSFAGEKPLSAEEIDLVGRVFGDAIVEAHQNVSADKTQADAPAAAESIAELGLPLYNEGRPLSFDEILQMAVVERLETGEASELIAQMKSKMTLSERKFRLSLVGRAGTDFASQSSGAGIEASLYLVNPAKTAQVSLAHYIGANGELALQREVADVAREVQTHIFGYARAHALEQSFAALLVDLRAAEIQAENRDKENMDLNALAAIREVRKQVERAWADRQTEKSEIKRLLGGLIGVVGFEINLGSELESLASDRNDQMAKEIRGQVADQLKSFGVELGGATADESNLNVAVAQGRYAQSVLETAYQQAREKMAVVLSLRIFYNFAGAFDLRAPLSFERDRDTHDAVHYVQRERLAIQYYQDAQAIEGNLKNLQASAERAQAIAIMAEERFARAKQILAEETLRYSKEAGWSKSFKAAVELYDLVNRQREHAYEYQLQVQADIDRFTANVSQTVEQFERDYEGDAAVSEQGKPLNAAYFQHLEELYSAPEAAVDASTVEASLQNSHNFNLRLEQLRATEVAERMIQALSDADVKFSAKFDALDVDRDGSVSEKEKNVTVTDLQGLERELFREYERATASSQSWLDAIRNFFSAKPRDPQVILAEIERVSAAKHLALREMLPGIMRGVWQRQAGLDQEQADGTVVHVQGSLEEKIAQAQAILNSEKASNKEKENAQRDLRALEFVLVQVRDDLQKLGDQGTDNIFKGSLFTGGGVEGIDLIPGAGGAGVFGVWDINQKFDGQIDFFYQALRESELLQSAHVRDLVANTLRQRQFLEQIPLRIQEYEAGIQNIRDMVILLEGQKKEATGRQAVELARQINWAQIRLSTFAEAVTNLNAELVRAKEQYARILGHGVGTEVNYVPGGATAFSTEADFRAAIERGMQESVPEEERRSFDPAVDARVADHRVRIHWSLLSAAEEQNYAQLYLMLPFISSEGTGGAASYRAYSGHLSKDHDLNVAASEENLRRSLEERDRFVINASLADERLDRQIVNTQKQKEETERLIREIEVTRAEYEAKSRSGYAAAGEADLYREIREVDSNVQRNNELNHNLTVKLLKIEKVMRDPVVRGEWTPEETARMQAINSGAKVFSLTPAAFDRLLEVSDDQTARSNFNLAQRTEEIQQQYRLLRHAAVSAQAFQIPLGLGSADDFQYGLRFTYDPLEALTDNRHEEARIRMEQAGGELLIRQDFNRRLIQLGLEDLMHARTISDIREDHARLRLQIARYSDVGGALEDRSAIFDSAERTRSMVETAANDREISESMFRFLAGIPQDVDIEAAGVNLLEQVFNGEEIGADMAVRMLEHAFSDPQYQIILKNIQAAEADAQQAWNKRWFDSQVGLFAGKHASAGAELTVHLVDREKAALVAVEQAKRQLAEVQADPALRQIQIQALNEYSAFVHNRIRLIQLAEDYAMSRNRADSVINGYRVSGSQGRTVTTMNDVLMAFDHSENAALKLAEAQFAFRKSSVNLSRTLALMGLPEDAEKIKTAGHRELPYATEQEGVQAELTRAREQLRDLENRQAEVSGQAAAEAQEPQTASPDAVYDKLQEPKLLEAEPAREVYLEPSNEAQYAPAVRRLWKSIFDADVTTVERGLNGEVRGGLTEAVIVEDVFGKLFDVMQLNSAQRMSFLRLMELLAGDDYLGGRLSQEDMQRLMAQIPQNEKLGLNFAQVIEGLLSNQTLVAESQDATNSELDKKTDFRVLGIYIYYAASLLKGLDAAALENLPAEQREQMIESALTSEFQTRLNRDFIFLRKILESIAAQTAANASPEADLPRPIVFTDAEIELLTRDGTFSEMVQVKDRRVDYAVWAVQQRELGFTGTEAELKQRFVLQALTDWFSYSEREVSEQPYFNFLIHEDTFEAFDQVRQVVNGLYRTNFGKNLALYGDIQDLSNITAWQFLTFMGKIYHPDENVRLNRLRTVVLLASHVLEYEQVQLQKIYGNLTDEDLRRMPSATMLRLLEQTAEKGSFADQREIEKERASLRNGLFFGEVIFRTIHAIEQHAKDYPVEGAERQPGIGEVLDHVASEAASIGDDSPALKLFDGDVLAQIRRDIRDFYLAAPQIRDLYNQSELGLKYPINFMDAESRGAVSAIYDFKVQNNLTDAELALYFDYMAQLREDVLNYHRVTQGIDFDSPEQHRLGRYPAVLSTEVLEMIRRGWSVEQMQQFISRKIMVFKAAQEHWTNRAGGSRLDESILGIYVRIFSEISEKYPDSGINLDSQESYNRLFMSINAAQFAIADAGQQLLKFLDLFEHPLLSWENAESRAQIVTNVKALSDRDVINFYVDLLQRRDVPEGEAIYLGTERMFRNGELLRNNTDLEQLQTALRDQLFRDIYLQAVYMTFNRDAGGQARDLDNAVLGYYADELERLPSGSSFEAVMDIAMKMKYSANIRQKAHDFRHAVAVSIDPEYKTNNPGLADKVTVPSDEGGLDGIVALIYNQGLESDNPQREFADSVWERKLADLFEDARVNLVAIYQRTGEFPEWTITPSLVFQGREEKAQAMSAGQAERTRNRMDVLTKLDPSLMDLGERGNAIRFIMQKWMQAFGEFVPDALLDQEIEIVESLGDDSNLKNTLIEKQAVARRMLDALLLIQTNGEASPEDVNQLWIDLFGVLSNDLTGQLQVQPEREFEQSWRTMFFSKAGNEFEAREGELQALHRDRQAEYAGFVQDELSDFIANPADSVVRAAAAEGLQNLAQIFYGADLSAEEVGKILDRFLINTTGRYSSPEQRLAAFFHYPLIKQAVRAQFQLDLNDEMASQVLNAMVGKGLALSSPADASQYGEGGMDVREAALAVYVIPLRVADLFQQHFGSLGNDPATWNRHPNWPYVAGLSAEITKRLAFFGLAQDSQQEILENVRSMVDLFIDARLDDSATPDWMRERLLNLQARFADLDFNSLLEIEMDRMGQRLARAGTLKEQFAAVGYEPSFDRILSLGGQAYMDEIPQAMIVEWVDAAREIAKALKARGVQVDDVIMRTLLFQVSLIYDVGLADNPPQAAVADASLPQATQNILEEYLAELEALNRTLPEGFSRFAAATQLTEEESAAVLEALQVRKVHPAMLKEMVRRAVDLRREVLAEAVADARETSLIAVLFRNDYFTNRFRAPRGTYDLTAKLSPFELLVAMDNLNSGSPDHLMLQQIAELKSKDLIHVQRVLGAYSKYKTEKELVAKVGEEAVTQNWSGFEKGLLKLSRGEGVELFGRTFFAGHRFSLMEMSGLIALAMGLSALMGFKLLGHHPAKKITPENFDFKKLPRFFTNEKADALSLRYSFFRAAVVALVSWALMMLIIQMSYVMIAPALFVFLLTFAVLWRVIPDVFILKVFIAPFAWMTGASKPMTIRYTARDGKTIATAHPRGVMRFIPKGFKSGPLGVVRNNGGAGDIENMETLFRDSATLLAESYVDGQGDQNLIAQSVLQLQVNRLGDNPAIKAALKSDPDALKKAIAKEHAAMVQIWGEQDTDLQSEHFFALSEDEQQKILVIKKLRFLRNDTEKRFNRIIAEVVDGLLADGKIQGDRDAIIRDVTDRFSNPFTFTNVPKPDPYYKSMRFIYEGGDFFDPLEPGAHQKLQQQPYLKSNPDSNPDPYVDQTLAGEIGGGTDSNFMNGFVGVIGGPADENHVHHIKQIQRRTMENLNRPLLDLVAERRAGVFEAGRDHRDTTAEDKKYHETLIAISSDFESVLGEALKGLQEQGVLPVGMTPELLSLRDLENLYRSIADPLEAAVELKKSRNYAQLSDAQRKANALKIHNLFENLKKVGQVMVLVLDGAQYRVLAFGEIHSSQIFDAGNSMLYAFYKRMIQYAMRSPSSIFQSRIKFVDMHKSMHASLMEDHPNNTLSFTQEALQAVLKMVRAFGKFLITNDIFYMTQARPFLKDYASKIRKDYGGREAPPLSEDEFHSAIAEVQTGIGPQYVREAEIGEDPTFNLSQRQKRAMARWTTFHDMYSYFRSTWMNNVYHAPVKSAFTHALLFGGTSYLFLKSIGILAILGQWLGGVLGASAVAILSPALVIVGFVVLVAVLAMFYKSIQGAMQRQMDAGKLTLPSHREGGAEINSMNNRGLIVEIFFLIQLIVMGAAMLSGSGIIIAAPVVGEILFGLTMAALLLPKVLFAPIYEIREWTLLKKLGLNPPISDLFYRPVRAMAFGALEAVLSTMQLLMLVGLMPGVVIKAYMRVQIMMLYAIKHPLVVKDGVLDKTLRKIYGWLEWGAPDSAAWTIAGVNAENPPFKQVAWLFKSLFMLGTIFFMLWLSPVVPAAALTLLGYAISTWFAVHAIYGGLVVRRGIISVPSGLEEKKQQEWYVTRGDAVTAMVFALGLAAASFYLPGLASFVPADFITRTSTITIMSWFFGIFSVFVVGYNIIKVQASAIMKSKVLGGKYVEFKYDKGLVQDSPKNRKWTDLISWALFGIGVLGAWLFFQGSLPEFIKPALVFVQAVNTGDGSSLATFMGQTGYDSSLRVETKFSWFFNAMGGASALLGPSFIIGTLIIIIRTHMQKLAGLRVYEKAQLAKQAAPPAAGPSVTAQIAPVQPPVAPQPQAPEKPVDDAAQKLVDSGAAPQFEGSAQVARLTEEIGEIESKIRNAARAEDLQGIGAQILQLESEIEQLADEGQETLNEQVQGLRQFLENRELELIPSQEPNVAAELDAGNETPVAEAPKSAAEELIESQGPGISAPSAPEQPSPSKNLRGEDAVVAGRFDLKAGEGELEVSLVGRVDDPDLAAELFKVMKTELTGKAAFELQFARRIQAGNFMLTQQSSSAPDFKADYKVFGSLADLRAGKEMPFRLVVIQARSEQRRSEVAGASENAMALEIKKQNLLAGLESARGQSLQAVLQSSEAAEYVDVRINQELDGFVNDALASDASILVADLSVMSRGDINVILSELAANGVKATVYVANAGDANEASFIVPADAQIKLSVFPGDVASIRYVALAEANQTIGTSVGITGMKQISGNVQMQRTVAAHLVGQFVIMTDDKTALMGVAKTLDVNSYITEIANSIRSEARIKQSA